MGKEGKFVFVFLLFLAIFLVSNVNAIGLEGSDFNRERVLDKIEESGTTLIYVNIKDEAILEKRGVSSRSLLSKGILKGESEGDRQIVRVNKEDLEFYEENSDKFEIEEIGYRKLFVDQSRQIVNGTVVYNLQQDGLNLTGQNQTVCVIDSGVNYTHPDFGSCTQAEFLAGNCEKIIDGYDYDNYDGDVMDDNGHGTHVAGIIIANGSLKGIAPDARIVALRACDNNGTCYDSSIIQSVNWCINNKDLYDIKVISMSFGSDCDTSPEYCSTGYCNSDPLAEVIQNATALNISVVVASGNEGNATAISGPACVEGAIPVGSSSGLSSSSFTNRWTDSSLFQIFAPGENINSTMITSPSDETLSSCGAGKIFCELSGTSMATPHVSAIIAIMNQYLFSTGQEKTTEEIKNALNSTDLIVDDTLNSGRYFPRVDLFYSLISLDVSSPQVDLVTPQNDTELISGLNTFSCNSTDLYLESSGIYLWNSSNDLVNYSNFSSINSQFNYTETVFSIDTSGDYYWGCEYYDENGNRGVSSVNRSLSLNLLRVSLDSPSNNTSTNQNETYTCSVESNYELLNGTFYLWNSSDDQIYSEIINVSGLTNSSSFQFNFSSEGNYYWGCEYYSESNISKYSPVNNTIIYDVTDPILTIETPLENQWYNRLDLNISLNEGGTCIYSLSDGIINYSLSNLGNVNFTGSNTTIADGSYNVTYYCNDSAGNINISRVGFNIDSSAPTVNLLSPSDGYSSTGTTVVRFDYNVTDSREIDSCSLALNGALVKINQTSVSQNYSNNISYPMTAGSYTAYVNCTDDVGNVGKSSSISITINAVVSDTEDSGSSSGGGGGGGSGTDTVRTYTLNKKQMAEGYSKNLEKGDKLKLKLGENNEEDHTLTIEDIDSGTVKIKIESDPVTVYLKEGETKKVSVTTDKFYDLKLTNNYLGSRVINLSVSSIWEARSNSGSEGESYGGSSEDLNLDINGETINSNSTLGLEVEASNNSRIRLFVAIIILALIIYSPFFAKKIIIKKHKRKWKKWTGHHYH